MKNSEKSKRKKEKKVTSNIKKWNLEYSNLKRKIASNPKERMKYNLKFKNAKIEKLAKGFRLCRMEEWKEQMGRDLSRWMGFEIEEKFVVLSCNRSVMDGRGKFSKLCDRSWTRFIDLIEDLSWPRFENTRKENERKWLS